MGMGSVERDRISSSPSIFSSYAASSHSVDQPFPTHSHGNSVLDSHGDLISVAEDGIVFRVA